jgi:hypothetical protein
MEPRTSHRKPVRGLFGEREGRAYLGAEPNGRGEDARTFVEKLDVFGEPQIEGRGCATAEGPLEGDAQAPSRRAGLVGDWRLLGGRAPDRERGRGGRGRRGLERQRDEHGERTDHVVAILADDRPRGLGPVDFPDDESPGERRGGLDRHGERACDLSVAGATPPPSVTSDEIEKLGFRRAPRGRRVCKVHALALRGARGPGVCLAREPECEHERTNRCPHRPRGELVDRAPGASAGDRGGDEGLHARVCPAIDAGSGRT